MKHELQDRSTLGLRAPFEALMTPTYALAEGILYGVSTLRRRLERGHNARKRQREIAKTVSEQSGLDDRILRDIGISRGCLLYTSDAADEGVEG